MRKEDSCCLYVPCLSAPPRSLCSKWTLPFLCVNERTLNHISPSYMAASDIAVMLHAALLRLIPALSRPCVRRTEMQWSQVLSKIVFHDRDKYSKKTAWQWN
jgi:hypothetical protein